MKPLPDVRVVETVCVPLPEASHPVDPLEAAEKALKEALQDLHLTPADQRVYTLLYALACDDHQLHGRPWAPSLREVSVFCIGDVLADSCAVSVRTVRRAVRKLEQAGLVASQAHHITLEGRTVSEGTIYTLLVHPGKRGQGRKLCVRPEAHKISSVDGDHLRVEKTNLCYRNISDDIATGNTAYLQVVQPKILERQKQRQDTAPQSAALCPIQTPYEISKGFKKLKDFLNKIVIERKEKTTVKVNRTLQTFVFRDLLNLTRKQIHQQMQARAQQLATSLDDSHVKCWMKVLWRYVKAFWEGRDHTQALQAAYQKTLKAGEFARSKAAYLLGILQQEGCHELLPI